MSVRPRVLLHRGWMEAHGYLLRVAHLGLPAARNRVLQRWGSGTVVYAHGDDLLLLLPTPEPVCAEEAPGLPLVRLAVTGGSVLSAVPLTEAELRKLAPPAGSVVTAARGIAEAKVPVPEQRLDPAEWLELEGWTAPPVTSLGVAPPEPPEVITQATFDARTRLEGIPEQAAHLPSLLADLRGESPEPGFAGQLREYLLAAAATTAAAAAAMGAAVAQLLAAARGRVPEARGGSARPGGGDGGSPGISLPSLPLLDLLAAPLALLTLPLVAVMGVIERLVGRNLLDDAPASANTTQQAAPQQQRPRRPSPLLDALKRWSARLLWRTPLGQHLNRKQAQYLAKMLDLFDRGDLSEALRHAIPLGGLADGSLTPSLGVPTPRSDLQISPHRREGGSGMLGSTGLMVELEQLYRRAFERLRDQDRIDEAAFVLAELLRANEEAVEFLEQHLKLRLAAELAEARELPPALVVRQWWIAGERERAVQIARRTGCFADALVRLERTDLEQAAALRVVWAGMLAGAGDYAQAVDVVWSVEEARRLALAWLDRAIDLGGVTAARMLPRKLTLVPEAGPEIREQILAMLSTEEADDAPMRLTLAMELRRASTPAAQALGRAAVRAVAIDVEAGRTDLDAAEFRKLVDATGDASLRADAPPVKAPAGVALDSREEALELRFERTDAGSIPVHDAVYLSNGRCLLALGEAGVRLVARDGRTVAHFDQPAHRLVPSDHEDRAIAMARRSDPGLSLGRESTVWRLSRLDLAARTARYWCEADLEAFAPDYDGSTWLVGTHGDFVALDATGSRLEALWRTRDVGTRITSISRVGNKASLLMVRSGAVDSFGRASAEKDEWQRWGYELPSLVLRTRTPLDRSEWGGPWARQVSPGGELAGFGIERPTAMFVMLLNNRPISRSDDVPLTLRPWSGAMAEIAVSDRWAVFALNPLEGTGCSVVDLKGARVRASFHLGGWSLPSLRIQRDSIVTIADEFGRVLVLDLEHGRLLRNLRIH